MLVRLNRAEAGSVSSKPARSEPGEDGISMTIHPITCKFCESSVPRHSHSFTTTSYTYSKALPSSSDMFIRHCSRSISRSLRTLSRVETSAERTSPFVRPLARYLSSSTPRLASQQDEFASAFEQSPLFNVIKSHPTAMEAIKDIGDLMQKKG